MTKTTHLPHFHILRVLLVLAVIILAAKLITMDFAYWFDEIFSLCIARESLVNQWRHWYPIDTHPPIYYWLLTGWVRVFGEAEYATRTLSGLFMAAALVYFLVKTWRLSWMAFAMGLLWLFTPVTLPYAAEVRSYSLLFSVSLVFFTRYIGLPRLDWKAYFLLAWLGGIHFFGMVLAGSFLLLYLLSQWGGSTVAQRCTMLAKAAACVLLPLAYFAWLWMYGKFASYSGGHFWISGGFVTAFRISLHTLVPFAKSASHGFLAGLPLLVLLLAILYHPSPKIPFQVKLATGSVLLSLACLLVVHVQSPIFVTRYLVGFVPPLGISAMYLLHSLQPGSRIIDLCLGGLTSMALAAGMYINYRELPRGAILRTNAKAIARYYNGVKDTPIVGLAYLHSQLNFGPYYSQRLVSYYYTRQNKGRLLPLYSLENLKHIREPVFVCCMFSARKYTKTLEAAGIRNYRLTRLPGENNNTCSLLVLPVGSK